MSVSSFLGEPAEFETLRQHLLFNARFGHSWVGIAPKNKERLPAGELIGVLVCGPEDMRPDLASASAKWNPRKNRLLKMPQDAFSCGCPLSWTFGESCRDRTP